MAITVLTFIKGREKNIEVCAKQEAASVKELVLIRNLVLVSINLYYQLLPEEPGSQLAMCS